MIPDESLYCLRCRKTVPKSVSDALGGFCASCHDILEANAEAAKRQAETEAIADAARQEQINAARASEFYNTNTGRGICPSCGSRNIQDWSETHGPDAITTCFLAALCFIPLIFAALFNSKSHHRRCLVCGHSWPI